jgi:hypothetical protein
LTPGRRTNRKNLETVKEQLCFTPSISWVNEKSKNLKALNSIECSSFTGACSMNGATINFRFWLQSARDADFRDFMRDRDEHCEWVSGES